MDVIKLIRQPSTTHLSRPSLQPVRLVLNRGAVIFNEVSGGDPTITVVAESSFSSGRLVAWINGQLTYYDASQANHAYALIGMTLNAANPGEVLNIRSQGEVTIAGWGLLANQIYFADVQGQLVASLSSQSLFSQIIGRAKNSNTLIFSPQTIYFNG